MTTKDTSGGAFPFSPNDQSTAHMATNGMSLRDWFAGQALAGMCGHPQALSKTGQADLLADARLMYQFADAMMAARQKDPPHDA